MNLGEALLKDKVMAVSYMIVMNNRRRKMEFYSTVFPRYYRNWKLNVTLWK